MVVEIHFFRGRGSLALAEGDVGPCLASGNTDLYCDSKVWVTSTSDRAYVHNGKKSQIEGNVPL